MDIKNIINIYADRMVDVCKDCKILNNSHSAKVAEDLGLEALVVDYTDIYDVKDIYDRLEDELVNKNVIEKIEKDLNMKLRDVTYYLGKDNMLPMLINDLETNEICEVLFDMKFKIDIDENKIYFSHIEKWEDFINSNCEKILHFMDEDEKEAKDEESSWVLLRKREDPYLTISVGILENGKNLIKTLVFYYTRNTAIL